MKTLVANIERGKKGGQKIIEASERECANLQLSTKGRKAIIENRSDRSERREEESYNLQNGISTHKMRAEERTKRKFIAQNAGGKIVAENTIFERMK